MQFCDKVQRSLVKSQGSSATTRSLRGCEHTNTSRKKWVVRKQDLFYLLFPGNKHQKPPHPHFTITFFLKGLKNKGPTLHNPTDSSAGNKTSQYKKQCPLQRSHLWTSQLSHQENSGYPESASCFQTGARAARA